jgi:hypothetical protein
MVVISSLQLSAYAWGVEFGRGGKNNKGKSRTRSRATEWARKINGLTRASNEGSPWLHELIVASLEWVSVMTKSRILPGQFLFFFLTPFKVPGQKKRIQCNAPNSAVFCPVEGACPRR